MTNLDQIRELAARLETALHLSAPAIGIQFSDTSDTGLPPFQGLPPKETPDGRTGKVSASCVFWMEATSSSFRTDPSDHRNCSVGSMTHGLVGFDDVSSNSDISELLSSGWVTAEMVPSIPVISERPVSINYGPIKEAMFSPDVVLIRINGRQLMVLNDAVADLQIEGKPQCHIIALAKEYGKVAASVGCALSRSRTGMSPNEMTCTIPIDRLSTVVQEVELTSKIDTGVAKYAAQDARRFS